MSRLKTSTIALLLGLFLGNSASGQYIWINLSYKVVLNPVDGTRPPGATDRNIGTAVDRMNALLDSFGRRYRMRLAHPPIEISGNYENGPAFWYAYDFFNEVGPYTKDFMESLAKDDANYAWRGDAINMYLTAGICGGKCSFPQKEDEIVIIGGCSAADGNTQLHELGHYFGLYHTQGSDCGCCGDGDGECDEPGDDEISDTLPDLPCWDRDQISRNAFSNLPYTSLNAGQKKLVDDTFQNLMSYHNAGNACNGVQTQTFQLTEQQLDVWTDFALLNRPHVTSGRVMLFDWRNNCREPGGISLTIEFAGECYLGPFPTLAPLATVSAGGRDLVAVIRPGNYPAPITITERMALIATRQGPVTLGQ